MMSIDPQLFSEINSWQFAFLREISEPQPGTLRIVIEQAEAEETSVSMEVGGIQITDLHRVRPTEESRVYEFVWESYVVYSVTDELYGILHDSETYSGRCLRIYSNSRFLTYASVATSATKEYPGPMNHIGVLTESHIIDVISTVNPQIARVK